MGSRFGRQHTWVAVAPIAGVMFAGCGGGGAADDVARGAAKALRAGADEGLRGGAAVADDG